MDFRTQLFDRLKAKGLSDSSVKLYVRALEKLNGDSTPFTSLNFLKKVPAVMASIAHHKPNTQRSILIAIVSALSLWKDKAGIDVLTKKYYDPMIKLRDEMKVNEDTHVKSHAQEENWVEWGEVRTKFELLQAHVKRIAKEQKPIDAESYNLLTDALVLGLYATIPPRRNKDFYTMIVAEEYVPETMGTHNVLDYNNHRFIFNDYKTAKTYGTQSIQIPKDLWEIIEVYIHKRSHKLAPITLVGRKRKGKKGATNALRFSPFTFLEHLNGGHFCINSITRILNRIFQRQISSSMLRHIFLSSKYGDLMEEQQTIAEGMAHSTSMQKAYIKH